MYSHVLLTVDLTAEQPGRKALPVALKLCEAFGAKLTILNVVPSFESPTVSQYFPAGSEAKIIETARAELEKFAEDNVPKGLATETHIALGTIYDEIIKFANRANVDLIVMGAHTPRGADYLLGPNAARVVRHSGKSVMVARD